MSEKCMICGESDISYASTKLGIIGADAHICYNEYIEFLEKNIGLENSEIIQSVKEKVKEFWK